jgi:signal transduction histidine kinase
VFAPVVINGETLAMVAVTSAPRPLLAAVRDLGPMLGVVAIALLAAGTAIAALMIFRPTHRRLFSLQQAARAIGEGQTGVRATATGGDEVAMLANAFNEMAGGLEERTQALVAADRSRRQLLADVSHELMTPLAAIRGYVETMAMPDLDLDPPTRQRYLSIVTDETERMEHIIGDLLDLARLEGSGAAWKQEPVSVASLFERVLQRHDPVLQAKGMTLDRTIAADAGVIVGDPNRLEQAIQNLATNAVRHTPEGGRIALSSERVADGIRLVIEDSGPGIPEEHLPRVFDRFYKVDTSRTGTMVPSGSGLGLSIVRAIVERHGGRIEAGNGAAGGARFEIVVPDLPAVSPPVPASI